MLLSRVNHGSLVVHNRLTDSTGFQTRNVPKMTDFFSRTIVSQKLENIAFEEKLENMRKNSGGGDFD